MAGHYMDNVTYTRGERIGSGAFGVVYKAHETQSLKVYALKDIKCCGNEDLQAGLREIRAMGGLTHANIVFLYNVKATQKKAFEATLSLLLEYCIGGDLNGRLNRPSSQALNFKWMYQIADGVDYLHGKRIVHRDLKPQNILLTTDENVKIADFGLAERFVRRRENQSWLEYYIERGVGAACYVAPEILMNRYTYKVDIFSVGVIFYAILERTFQETNGEKLYGIFVRDGSGKKQPLGIHLFNVKEDVEISFSQTTSITRLIKRTLAYDYNSRPEVREVRLTLKPYVDWACRVI